MLPPRDMELCRAEIAYACDELHADGIGLPTSGIDVWLGGSRSRPMVAELSRRRAVVFIHP